MPLQDFIFHTYIRMRKILLLISGLLISTVASFSQDSGALIEALIRKGVLTNQEAEDIRADLVRENNVIPSYAFAGNKSTDRLSIGARMQIQYANLNTKITGATVKPVPTDHFFTRRMYLTFKAGLGEWGSVFTYDFAGGSYDDAIIQWKPTPDINFDFGLRKVNVAYEERGSSGNLKSIERSGITRYFVETNNGRRLGAASYRIGAFLDGKKEITSKYGIVYSAAVTNPERDETFAGASAIGNNATNKKAYWGNVGITGKLSNNGSWIIGTGIGLLPDQGGPSNTNLGKGYGLNIYSVYFDATMGRLGILSEYLSAKIEKGASVSKDANPFGWYVQPSFMITEKVEVVARYQHLDTDGRGVSLSDVVRSSPSAATMNKFTETYVGFNWYIKNNDLKFQLGALNGKTTETLVKTFAEAKTTGIRSQLQLQF